jgi:TolB-like protein/class 3 adenylate cyclase/cytochrome c-type biogenesis protein CcmH/NrfG
VFVADAVDYCRLMGADEVGTHSRFKADLDELLRPMIAEYRGRVVKTTGDGLMAEFVSVVDAVQCAYDIQQKIEREDASERQVRPLKYRIGINLGDIMVEDDDIYGDDVNVAVRLESLAATGGISISDAAYRSVRRKLDLEFQDLGEHRFKNIAEPIRVFGVIQKPGPSGSGNDKDSLALDGDPTGSGPQSSDAPAAGAMRKPTIVVLPFENFSRDQEQEYFCDGMTNDITTDLSRFRNLFVIAANSAYAYKGKRPAPQEVGRDLGVRYLLEGSVQKTGDRLRINAQLVEAGTGHHLWAERFERGLEDLRVVQDEIIQRIVVALAFKVDAAERARVLRKDPVKLNAYEAYLKGEHLFSQHSKQRMKQSREMFALATRLDPSFARAWGYYAYTCARSVVSGWMGREVLEEALELAQKAVALDPDDYGNHWDLAYVALNLGRFDQSLSEYERAVLLNPNDADLLCEMAVMLIRIGEPARGIRQIKRAMEINPYFPEWYTWNLGWGYFNARQYKAAIEELGKMNDPPKNVWLARAAAHARLGQKSQAREALGRFIIFDPGCTIEDQRKREIFKKPEDEEHWLESLRMAGLTD